MLLLWTSYFLGLLGILFVLLYIYTTRKFNYWKQRNIPEVKPIPFVGSIWPVLTFKRSMGEWLMDQYNKIKGDAFGIFVLDRPVLVLKSPTIIKTIFTKDFDYFADRTVEAREDDELFRSFIFIMKNPLWRKVRAKVSPMFTSGKLKAMLPLVLHEGKQMTDYLLKQEANTPNVNIRDLCGKYTTNSMARCLFAVDAHVFQNENSEFRAITKGMTEFSLNNIIRQLGSWLMPGMIKLFRIQYFHPWVVDACRQIFTEVLHSKMESNNTKVVDLVDMLIEANRKNNNLFSEGEMIGHSIQFTFAAYDTISAVLSFTLYELAINPEMQERLRNEIMKNHETNDGLTYEGLREMKYLDMVVCETLRKYPVLGFLDRTCTKTYKVKDTDLVIEKGTAVYIPVVGLNYDPKFYPKPHEFDPERFADKTWINRDMCYFPFGDGPRICIGERFGLMVVKVGIASLLLKFRVERTNKTPVPIKLECKTVVIAAAGEVPLRFEPL